MSEVPLYNNAMEQHTSHCSLSPCFSPSSAGKSSCFGFRLSGSRLWALGAGMHHQWEVVHSRGNKHAFSLLMSLSTDANR